MKYEYQTELHMRNGQFMPWNETWQDGDTEHLFKFHADVTPGDPGKYYGAYEDCYPATPAEVEITSAVNTVTGEDFTDKIPHKVIERITDSILDELQERGE